MKRLFIYSYIFLTPFHRDENKANVDMPFLEVKEHLYLFILLMIYSFIVLHTIFHIFRFSAESEHLIHSEQS